MMTSLRDIRELRAIDEHGLQVDVPYVHFTPRILDFIRANKGIVETHGTTVKITLGGY